MIDETAILIGAVVALVQLYRTIARPPDALLPVAAMLAGVLVHVTWSLVPAAVQQDVLIGAALGLMAVGGHSAAKTLTRAHST